MRGVLYCFVLFVSSFSLKVGQAQALIEDGSFENNLPGVDCEAGIHTRSKSWDGYGTCELFKTGTCAAGPIFPWYILNNGDTIWSTDAIGSQQPLLGDYLAAIRLFDDEIREFHEFIFTKLTQPLDSGTLYLVYFYVSPAESEEYLSNDIGIAFMDTAPPLNLRYQSNPFNNFNPRPNYYYNLPHLMYEGKELIDNYDGWTKINFYYEAKGNENYLVIGNFNDDASTNKVKVRDNCSACRPSSRMFIDHVHIEPCTISYIDLGEDTMVICNNEILELDFSSYAQNFFWSDGSNSATRSIDSTGFYSFSYSDNFCELRDSFYLYRLDTLAQIEDILLCSDQNLPIRIDLDYPFHPDNVFKLNGQEMDVLVIDQLGEYNLELSNNNCFEEVTFSVLDYELNYSIGPNPSNGLVRLNELIPYPVEVKVHSANGSLVFEGLVKEEIDLRFLADGVYFLTFDLACTPTKRIVISK